MPDLEFGDTPSAAELSWEAAAPSVSIMGLSTQTGARLVFDAEAGVFLMGLSSTGAAALKITAAPVVTQVGFVTTTRAGLRFEAAEPQQSIPIPLTTTRARLEARARDFTIETSIAGVHSFLIRASTPRANAQQTVLSNLTVSDAALQIYALWGFEIHSPLDLDFARARVLAAINAAMQTIFAQAHRLDYFNARDISATVLAGQGSVALPDSVQAVQGQVRLSASGSPLRKIETLVELRRFVDYYYGDTIPPSEPRAYALESTNQSVTGEIVAIRLHVAPAPAANTDLLLRVSIEAPRYTETNLRQFTLIDLPANYVQSLLYPLLRHWAASDTLFKKETLRPEIEAKHRQAMITLGLLDPNPPKLQSRKPRATPSPAPAEP